MDTVILVLVCCGFVLSGYLAKRNRLHFRLLFAIGYFLYTKTHIGYYYHCRRLHKKRLAAHSKTEIVQVGGDVLVYSLAILDDNYSYIVVEKHGRFAVVIDPADPYIIQKTVNEEKLNLRAILTTHKHWDHAGGNLVLKQLYPHLTIYGSKTDKPLAVNQFISDGDQIEIGNMVFTVLSTPGHTTGHVVYVMTSTDPPCLFSGDHLFLGGCGKIFECDVQTMYKSLAVIKSLNQSTLIFPGHEYTYNNLKFAVTVEPSNVILQEKLSSVRKLRLKRMCTVPASLSDELQYNPFLRTNVINIQAAVSSANELLVLKELRKLKDDFKTN